MLVAEASAWTDSPRRRARKAVLRTYGAAGGGAPRRGPPGPRKTPGAGSNPDGSGRERKLASKGGAPMGPARVRSFREQPRAPGPKRPRAAARVHHHDRTRR